MTKLDFLFLAQKPYKLSNQLPNPNIYFWPILAYKYQSINFIKLRFTKKKKKNMVMEWDMAAATSKI